MAAFDESFVGWVERGDGLAIDDVEMSIRTAEVIQQNFPHLKIFARARNRGHVYRYMEMGIKKIKRETFDSGAFFVKDLLIDMGFEPNRAGRIIEKFRIHDEIMLKKQFSVRKDDRSLMSVSQQGADQLAEVLRDETLQSNIVIGENPETSPSP